MRSVIVILTVGALAFGGYWLWKQKRPDLLAKAPARQLATAMVEARDISFAILSAGDIGPADQVSVRSEVPGRILELPVDIGDQVKKGELLCRLDDRDLQTERQQRQAEIAGTRLQIESARLNLEKAQRDFERNRKLFEDLTISKEAFENFKTDFERAENQVQLASNSLDRAEKALDLVEYRLTKTRLEAPFDCTVLIRPVSLGQTVSGAAGFNSGTEIMTIANLNDMIVNAHVNQADVIRLTPNQAVDISVESLPGLRLRGSIERIAPQATIRNGIKGFTTRIQIEEMDSRVRPGMTATLSIPVASAEHVLCVPLAAVFSEEGTRFVYVKSGQVIQKRPVNIGITDYQFAEVQKGLSAGELVLLEPPKPEEVTVTPGESGVGNQASNPVVRTNGLKSPGT